MVYCRKVQQYRLFTGILIRNHQFRIITIVLQRLIFLIYILAPKIGLMLSLMLAYIICYNTSHCDYNFVQRMQTSMVLMQ